RDDALDERPDESDDGDAEETHRPHGDDREERREEPYGDSRAHGRARSRSIARANRGVHTDCGDSEPEPPERPDRGDGSALRQALPEGAHPGFELAAQDDVVAQV